MEKENGPEVSQSQLGISLRGIGKLDVDFLVLHPFVFLEFLIIRSIDLVVKN